MDANQIVISLLGRLVFPEEKLKNIICKNKQDPAAYLIGYNSCDGNHNLTEIAKIIDVTPGTLVPILQLWEKIGIVYEIEPTKGKRYYKNLYILPEDPSMKRKEKKEKVQKVVILNEEIKIEDKENGKVL